ncbi:MAG: chemotaxis protein CheD [Eubacteriales bacterium]
MSEVIKVGMADSKICVSPDALITLGLGSCVGIALRDPNKKIGGLAHIMLPDSTKIAENSNVNKFADTGIDEVIRLMIAKGADRRKLVAKIAGGAQMFNFGNNSTNTIRVGERNIEATIAKLSQLRIPILAKDVGDSYGRTVTFYPEDGSFKISAVGKSVKII